MLLPYRGIDTRDFGLVGTDVGTDVSWQLSSKVPEHLKKSWPNISCLTVFPTLLMTNSPVAALICSMGT